MNIQCRKCKSTEIRLFPANNGIHHGKLICGSCNSFIKWANKLESEYYESEYYESDFKAKYGVELKILLGDLERMNVEMSSISDRLSKIINSNAQ